MLFLETRLRGAYLIVPERNEDQRGYFARTFCRREFSDNGLNPDIAQCSFSYNKKQGTFRGMHFQRPPFEEDKVVMCLSGSLVDYIADLRPLSPTYREWIAVELNASNRYSLYIPKSFAHGFFTLADDTLIQYQMSEFYHPECSGGFRYDDPAFNIQLPGAITSISCRDKTFADLFVPAD
jgi:dTDP-4-dehydrorhamnose 3,5-epimerase